MLKHRFSAMLAVAGLAMTSLFPSSSRSAVKSTSPARTQTTTTPPRRQLKNQRSEIAAWNAEVDAKKAAKKARKVRSDHRAK